jgi:hypothetical protein
MSAEGKREMDEARLEEIEALKAGPALAGGQRND